MEGRLPVFLSFGEKMSEEDNEALERSFGAKVLSYGLALRRWIAAGRGQFVPMKKSSKSSTISVNRAPTLAVTKNIAKSAAARCVATVLPSPTKSA